MRKTSDSTKRSERGALRALAAIALSGSLAAFGCTTNRTPGYGEPAMSAPAAGPVAPNATSTPGSSGTMPQAMISSSPAAGESAAVDAIAVIKADQAFRGKNLGPAAPGDNSVPSQSMLYPTGQQINAPAPAPGFYATTPPMIVGDTGVILGGTVPAGTSIAPTANAGTGAAATAGGTTGLSSTTATPVANSTAAGVPTTVSTGLVTASAPGSSVAATPILSAVGPQTTGTSARGTSIAGGTSAGLTNLTAGVTTTPTAASSAITNATGGTATVGVANPAAGMTSAATAANTASSDRLTRKTTTATTKGTVSAGIRVETAPNGSVVVTNSSPSLFRRFLNSIGFRRTATTTSH